MEDKKRVWIHARVSSSKYLDLLSYQEKILTELDYLSFNVIIISIN